MSKNSVFGLGAMGSRMAAHLVKAGHDVTARNGGAGAAKPPIAAGAAQAPAPREAAAEIALTIAEILSRLDLNDQEIAERIESPEYLKLIKKSLRDWPAAESEEKRVLIRNLLTNAAVHRICSDEAVRMFIQWIETYSEAHFAVIRFIHKNMGATRLDIWRGVHGERTREDSAEADLFKLIIHDLSTGHVIRQHREKDDYGNYVRQGSRGGSGSSATTSAFDDKRPNELTELGRQFVRYTIEDGHYAASACFARLTCIFRPNPGRSPGSL